MAPALTRVSRPARLETAWTARSPGARANISARLVPTEVEGLLLLPALVQGDPDSLASSPVRDLIERLKSQSDIVVMDSPAVGEFADAQILSNYADAVVVVARSGRTRVRDLKRAVQTLDRAGVGPIGVVVNKVKRRGRR
jgi:Mrp family chromosome partitioning ATPase